MTDYAKLKVTELKDLVKERGIVSTGLKLKQNFVDALEADDASNGRTSANDSHRSESPHQDAAVEEQAGVAAEGDEEAEAMEEQSGTTETVDDGASADDARENTNKRKRRSPTPPVSEETVHKKLKTADQNTDDNAEVKPPGHEISGEMNTDQDDEAPEEPAKKLSQEADDTEMEDAPTTGLPSKHPHTSGLYIRELVRPLQPNSLREHILHVAQPEDKDMPPAGIEAFHLDKLRSHALVLFSSVSAATRARTALHNTVWPDEPMRKPLWVDFVPADKVQKWIDIEVGRGDMTRWEVVYDRTGLDSDGPVVASLQEADAGHSGARKPSGNAPSTRPQTGMGETSPSVPRHHSAEGESFTPVAHESPKPAQSRFDSLDDMYNFTEAKPKIYYQPVSQDLAQRRQGGLDRETSRDWTDADADPSAYGEGELRRYTFEDGDRLVDGGADFGLFGRRGRGGGFTRGGRGRGGDHYRGGGGGGGGSAGGGGGYPNWRR